MGRLGSRGARAAPAEQRVAAAVTLKVTEVVGLQEIRRIVKFVPSAESRPPSAGPRLRAWQPQDSGWASCRALSQLKPSGEKMWEKGNCCSSPGPYAGLLPAAGGYLQALWKNDRFWSP